MMHELAHELAHELTHEEQRRPTYVSGTKSPAPPPRAVVDATSQCRNVAMWQCGNGLVHGGHLVAIESAEP